MFPRRDNYLPQTTRAQTPTTQISIINESTVLADADVATAVAALQKQVTGDFRPPRGTDAELSITITPKGAQPTSGSWWLVLLDDSGPANALGYHHLTTEGLPRGKAFAASDRKAGTSWAETASQERLPMLGDPNINLAAFVQNSNAAGRGLRCLRR